MGCITGPSVKIHANPQLQADHIVFISGIYYLPGPGKGRYLNQLSLYGSMIIPPAGGAMLDTTHLLPGAFSIL